jgi:hypothetical protein
MKENIPIIYELKCRFCGKVCGKISFTAKSTVDFNELHATHITYCEEHTPDIDIKS